MRRALPPQVGGATESSAMVCQQRQDPAEPLWFALMCREIWSTNAPKELEFKTGRSDRTCRAWASGDSPPPVNVLLILLRDPDVGARVPAYCMRDCNAPWWRGHLRAERITAQVDAIDLS